MIVRSTPISGQTLVDSLEADPVIASIKDNSALDSVLVSERNIVFVLYGSVLDIGDISARCKAAGKLVLVNIDLVDGMAAHDTAIKWLAQNTAIDGILSTKSSLVRSAQKCGLIGVQRFFLVDSFSYHQLLRVLKHSEPDFVEILPGCIPRVIEWLREEVSTPIIAGGLVCEKSDVIAALGAGALAVATSEELVWGM